MMEIEVPRKILLLETGTAQYRLKVSTSGVITWLPQWTTTRVWALNTGKYQDKNQPACKCTSPTGTLFSCERAKTGLAVMKVSGK